MVTETRQVGGKVYTFKKNRQGKVTSFKVSPSKVGSATLRDKEDIRIISNVGGRKQVGSYRVSDNRAKLLGKSETRDVYQSPTEFKEPVNIPKPLSRDERIRLKTIRDNPRTYFLSPKFKERFGITEDEGGVRSKKLKFVTKPFITQKKTSEGERYRGLDFATLIGSSTANINPSFVETLLKTSKGVRRDKIKVIPNNQIKTKKNNLIELESGSILKVVKPKNLRDVPTGKNIRVLEDGSIGIIVKQVDPRLANLKAKGKGSIENLFKPNVDLSKYSLEIPKSSELSKFFLDGKIPSALQSTNTIEYRQLANKTLSNIFLEQSEKVRSKLIKYRDNISKKDTGIKDLQFNDLFNKPNRFVKLINYNLNVLREINDRLILNPKTKYLNPNYIISKNIRELGSDTKSRAVNLGITGVLAGIGFLRGGLQTYNFLRNPKKGVIEQYQSLRPKNIGKTAGQLKTQILIDPAGTIAEFYAFSKTFDVALGKAKAAPLARYLTEEAFIFRQPPKYRKVVRAIIRSSEFQKLAYGDTKGINIKPFFLKVKALNPVEAKALIKTLKETDSVVFGSLASYIQSKGKTPIPKDVDLATTNKNLFAEKFIKNLPKNTRQNYKLVRGKLYKRIASKSLASDPKGVKNFGGKIWDPIFDVKTMSQLIPNKGLLTRTGKLPASGQLYKGKKLSIFKSKKVDAYVNLNANVVKYKNSYYRRVKDPSLLTPKDKVIRLKGSKDIWVKFKPKKATLTTITSPYFKDVNKVKGQLLFDTQKLIKIDGVTFTTFAEQTLRKGLGTLQALLEKNTRRAKDPQSFLISLEIQLQNLKSKKTYNPIKRIKIKRIEDTIKLLKSKEFLKLLDPKVRKSVIKDYPLISKISKAKLKDLKPTKAKKIAKDFVNTNNKLLQLQERLKKEIKKNPKTKKGIKAKNDNIKKLNSEIKKVNNNFKSVKSKLPKGVSSYLPKSVLPSRIPKSIIPSKLPSKIPSSLVPSSTPSSLKSSKNSVLPSTLVSSKLYTFNSKLKSSPPSRVPPSQLKRSKLRSSKLPKGGSSKVPKVDVPKFPKGEKKLIPQKEENNEILKKAKKSIIRNKYIYLPDLYSILYGLKATKSEVKQLLRKGRIFTGLEARKLVA